MKSALTDQAKETHPNKQRKKRTCKGDSKVNVRQATYVAITDDPCN